MATKDGTKIDFADELSVAYWCGTFCCTPAELRSSADKLGTQSANDIGMFLADRHVRRANPDTPDACDFLAVE
jgi:hypothetical protein